jgi:hypothetical protein
VVPSKTSKTRFFLNKAETLGLIAETGPAAPRSASPMPITARLASATDRREDMHGIRLKAAATAIRRIARPLT